jgi:hypothetical protein
MSRKGRAPTPKCSTILQGIKVWCLGRSCCSELDLWQEELFCIANHSAAGIRPQAWMFHLRHGRKEHINERTQLKNFHDFRNDVKPFEKFIAEFEEICKNFLPPVLGHTPQLTLALGGLIGRHPQPRELEEVEGLDTPRPLALESRRPILPRSRVVQTEKACRQKAVKHACVGCSSESIRCRIVLYSTWYQIESQARGFTRYIDTRARRRELYPSISLKEYRARGSRTRTARGPKCNLCWPFHSSCVRIYFF